MLQTVNYTRIILDNEKEKKTPYKVELGGDLVLLVVSENWELTETIASEGSDEMWVKVIKKGETK